MPPHHPADTTLRQLGAPKRISVESDERGFPLAVFRERGQLWLRVEQVQDRWRIDDEWWSIRGEISRMYFLLELEGAQLMTVFRDLTTGYWYEQRDTRPIEKAAPIDIFADKSDRRDDEGGSQEAIERRRQREWAEKKAAKG